MARRDAVSDGGAADTAQVVLLTGFPSLQARKLLGLILREEPDTRAVVVVLPKLLDQAIAALLAFDEQQRARVEVLEGDAAAIDMGLSGHEFRQLAATVTRIHHLAKVSYVGAELDAAHYANVRGAVEAVELASACDHIRCLVHHSTAHVSGDRTGIVYESELDEAQGFHSVVQETRMKAEMVMRRAMSKLPIAVVRPTMMVGDSITGEADRFDGPYLLVMLMLGLPSDMAVPLPAGGGNTLDIVPVDYVVRAAHQVGVHADAPGQTFHLTSCDALTAREVLDLIAKAGGRRTAETRIPAQVASAFLGTPGIKRLVKEPRAFMQQLTSRARYDTRTTRRLLASAGITCPPLSDYVGTWVTAVQEHLRQRQ
jgi:thioester reductase-like protein